MLLVIVNVLALGALSGLMNTLFGGDRQVKSGSGGAVVFEPDEGIIDKHTAKAAGDDLVAEEGFILFKNVDHALPLLTRKNQKTRVTVLGKNSVKLVYGSAGSVSADASRARTLSESLEAAGYEVNPVLKAFYESSRSGSGRPSSCAA